MATYLLTWNPRKWDWKELSDLAAITAKRKLVEGGWSCGNTQCIEVDDRIFLLRQGSNAPGMIGAGWATSRPERLAHWDRKKRKARKKTWFIDVDWDALLPVERRLRRAILEEDILKRTLLNTRPSGVSIDAASAVKLEKCWAKHLKRPVSIAALSQGMQQAQEGEMVEQTVYRQKRDRKLRNQAMENSDGKCEACGKDYSKVLNQMGLRCLQVHHRKQLARNKAPRITKLSDLAIVCANCHSLIHFDPKKALQVAKLKAMLRGSRTWLPQ